MAQQPNRLTLQRGEVVLVNFDPTVGSEIKKIRPALILQNDIANRHSPVTIVATISSQIDATVYPIEVLISPSEGGVSKPSLILLNQIRTIDKQRVIKKIGRLKPETMTRVDQALQISLGLVEI